MLRQTLPKELRIYLIAFGSLYAASILDALIYIQSRGIKLAFSRLFVLHPLFDLFCYQKRFQVYHPITLVNPAEYRWYYPAPCAFIYRFLYLFSNTTHSRRYTFELYVAAFTLCLLTAGILFARVLKNRSVPRWQQYLLIFASLLVSWPVYLGAQRGNIEIFLCFGLGLALAAYMDRRWMLAAIGIGIIASFKLYPLLLLALFLRPLRLKEIAVGMGAFLATTLAGFLYVGPTLAESIQNEIAGIRGFMQQYSAKFDLYVIGYDHSGFAIIKYLFVRRPDKVMTALPFYTLITGILLIGILLIGMRKLPRPNQLLVLSSMVLLFPSTSFDYTLMAMYVPWVWFVLLSFEARAAGRSLPAILPAMLCFAVLFAPETFIHFHGLLFAGEMKAVALISLIVVGLCFPVPELGHQNRSGIPSRVI